MNMPDANLRKYTYEDYEQWEGRWELIQGIPYNMTPALSTKHQYAVGELYGHLRAFFSSRGCHVFVAPFDVRFSETDDYSQADTVVQPDISVFCHRKQLDQSGAKGAPSLTVEVLSPSTAVKDRNKKFKLYEKYGVKEYWIVDPVHETVEIYNLQEGNYHLGEVYGTEQILQSIHWEELQIPIESLFLSF
ncbi:Uma2 family endonuclease [Ectobacillus panaciterrae]|uniref:Uma2 family endonuclease n=1 Tax=Ectobacillus panaciterrae TaxID=363872 RepID=UPI00048D685A|nr:Uma2 family endonuclease [Ectobacillus panaciterrae]